MPGTGGDGLASVAETLAGLTATARAGSLDDTAALTALAAARQIAAELEHSELALIEAARDAGATWTRIAAALGARNRQTAQKRHTDLARRCPRPPSVDTPTVQPGPRVPEGNLPEAKTLVSMRVLFRRAQNGRRLVPGKPASQSPAPVSTSGCHRRPRNPPRPGGVPLSRGSPAPSSPRAATNSCGHPTTPKPAPGTCWSAAGSRDWSGPPGAESAAGPAGNRSTPPATRCPPPGSAGSPPPGTPAPAMPPQSACCAPCSASRKRAQERCPLNRVHHRSTPPGRIVHPSTGAASLASDEPKDPSTAKKLINLQFSSKNHQFG